VTRMVRSCVDGPVFHGDLVRWDDVGTIPFDALGAPGWNPRRQQAPPQAGSSGPDGQVPAARPAGAGTGGPAGNGQPGRAPQAEEQGHGG
jgi:hypothetical protein